MWNIGWTNTHEYVNMYSSVYNCLAQATVAVQMHLERTLRGIFTWYNKKTTWVPVLSHQTTRVKTYHLSAKREGDEFFTEGGLVNENSNEGGFLFIMNLKI